MIQINKRTENIFETIVENNLFGKVEILVDENKRGQFSEYIMLNYGLEVEKSEQENLKSEKTTKTSRKNGDKVNNKTYIRRFDFKRDDTNSLVKKYENPKYVSYRDEIHNLLMIRLQKIERMKNLTSKNILLLKRLSVIESDKKPSSL